MGLDLKRKTCFKVSIFISIVSSSLEQNKKDPMILLKEKMDIITDLTLHHRVIKVEVIHYP